MTQEVVVKITIIDHPEIDDKFLASINEGEYKNTLVGAKSIAECFKELAISMAILDDYRSRHNTSTGEKGGEK